MKNKKYYGGRSRKENHKRNPNPKANRSVWNKVGVKAAELGYDSKKMSRLYRKLERKEELKKIKASRRLTPIFKTASPKKQSTTNLHIRKYIPKKLILDDLREYRSSKIISSVSNSFAEFIVKTTTRELTNSQKNVLRSIIALATSEALNKAFEKELDTIDKVQTFVKIGKVVYKVILWYDEQSKTYRTDSKHIKKVPEFSIQYKHFLSKHPVLKEIYNNQNCLSLEEVKSGKRCLVREQLERNYTINTNDDLETPNSCPYYYYCHN